MTLTPWREVVTPHPDLVAGRYRQAEFAADLADVLAGAAGEGAGAGEVVVGWRQV